MLALHAGAEHTHCLDRLSNSLLRSLCIMRLSVHQGCNAFTLKWRAMYVQLRDSDVANAELVEEKRLSRELSAQVQEYIQGECPE